MGSATVTEEAPDLPLPAVFEFGGCGSLFRHAVCGMLPTSSRIADEPCPAEIMKTSQAAARMITASVSTLAHRGMHCRRRVRKSSKVAARCVLSDRSEFNMLCLPNRRAAVESGVTMKGICAADDPDQIQACLWRVDPVPKDTPPSESKYQILF